MIKEPGYTIDENELHHAKIMHNIDVDSIYANVLSLNRFKIAFPGEVLENTIGHVFFSKPELNIFDESSGSPTPLQQILNIPDFNTLLKTDLELFRCLQSNIESPTKFIAPLSNYARNFNSKDEIIKTRVSAETSNDWKVMYGHRLNDSRSADSIDINFEDDRNLNVYKVIKIWVNYIHLISIGLLSPTKANRRDRILDYAGSIYFFLTSEDGESIIYYCQLKGVFPINIPSSVFSWDLGTSKNMDYSVSFQYSIKDESPLVIKDFNNITSEPEEGYVNARNHTNNFHSNTWTKGARVVDNNGKLKLKYFV